MLLPIADYAPDLPPNNQSGASANIVNLFPRTSESWGPVNSLGAISSNALTSKCIGALTAIDTGANNYLFAGDATKLYLLSPGSSAFATLNTGFSVNPGENWNFVQFGQRIIAAAFGVNLQSYVLNSSVAFANLAGSPPQARYMAVIRDWVMVGNTFDGTNGAQPQRVQWCAIDDPTNWPVAGSVTEAQLLAGSQIVPGDQGWIQGLVGNLGTSDGAIFFERAIWRVVYQGAPTVFGFYPCEGVRGTHAPKSIVQVGSLAYYLGEDGFYAFDGSNSKPIGMGRVDKTFFSNVNTSFLYNVIGAVDPINRLVMWIYPSTASTTGAPDSMLMYSWALDKWSFAQISADYIFRAFTQGFSLDSLDSTGYTLDTLPFSLDSRVWTGGNIVMAAFDANHKLAYFNAAVLPATADTVELNVFGQGSSSRRAFINSTRPLIDAGNPSVQVAVRQRLTDTPTFVTASALDVNGECQLRADGRYVRARIKTSGNFNHLQGCEVYAVPAGQR